MTVENEVVGPVDRAAVKRLFQTKPWRIFKRYSHNRPSDSANIAAMAKAADAMIVAAIARSIDALSLVEANGEVSDG